MKFINELTEKQRKSLSKELKIDVITVMKCLFTTAEMYDINKEELFDVWRYLEEKCFNQMQAKNVKGITVEEGMKMLKALLDLGKG